MPLVSNESDDLHRVMSSCIQRKKFMVGSLLGFIDRAFQCDYKHGNLICSTQV